MKSLKIVAVAALLLGLLPHVTHAEPLSVWALTATDYSNQIYRPVNALGEPDAVYADYFEKDAHVTLDFELETTSDLTVHMKLLNLGAAMRVDFQDETGLTIATKSHIFKIGETEVTLPYTGADPYRFVKITNIEDEVWKLDAVEAMVELEEEEMEEEEEEEELDIEEMDDLVESRLVTLPDDGNPATTHDEAVYVVGDDGSRHAFPNETVFFSWYENFDDVVVIDEASMAAMTLGANVTMRPGTHLVKITANPHVYAVEPGGTLRHIASEQIAEDLYGDDWAARVVDVADVFWGNYEVGEAIEAAVHPSGTLGVTKQGEVIYISNGVRYSLPGEVKSALRLRNEFFTPIDESLEELYVDGGSLTSDPEIAFPY